MAIVTYMCLKKKKDKEEEVKSLAQIDSHSKSFSHEILDSISNLSNRCQREACFSNQVSIVT